MLAEDIAANRMLSMIRRRYLHTTSEKRVFQIVQNNPSFLTVSVLGDQRSWPSFSLILELREILVSTNALFPHVIYLKYILVRYYLAEKLGPSSALTGVPDIFPPFTFLAFGADRLTDHSTLVLCMDVGLDDCMIRG